MMKCRLLEPCWRLTKAYREIQDFRPAGGNVQDPVQVFNAYIDSLADAIQKLRITHLESQVDYWEKCSFPEKSGFVQKAREACQLVCDVMAPWDGEALFQAIVDHEQKCKTSIDVGLQTLTVAYLNAPTKSVKTQKLFLFMLTESQPTSLNAYIRHLKTSPINK